MDSSALLAQAKKKISRREFGEAEELLNKALEVNPEDANIYFLIGSSAYSRSSHDDAFSALENALRLEPSSVAAQVAQIKVALKLRKNSYAYELADRVVKADSQNIRNCMVAARAFSRMGKHVQAAEILSNISADHKGKHELLAQSATYYFKGGEYEQAKRVAQRAFEINPQDTKPLVVVVNAAEALDDVDGFVQALSMLAEKDSNAAMGFLPALILAGRLEVAADMIVRAGEQTTIDPVLRETLVNMLLRQASVSEANDDVVGALHHIKAVCVLDSTNRAAIANLHRLSQLVVDAARILLKNGDVEQSLTKFKQAAEIDPTNEKFLLQVAKVSEINGSWIEAANAWLKLSRQHAGRREEYVVRACRVARKSDDHDKALDVLVEARTSLEVFPAEIGEWGDATARKVYKLGKESFDEGHIELAFERVTALFKWDRKSELVSKLGSKIERKLGQKLKEMIDEKVDATKIAHQMLSLNPSQGNAIRYMARRCFAQGSYADAANWYKTLVEKAPDEEQAWIRWLRCHVALHDFEGGKVVAGAMAERFPSNKDARVFLSKMEDKAA